MKARSYQINALKEQIRSHYKAALVYGADQGVIQETSEQIALTIVPDLKDDFTVIKVFQSQLKEYPSLLSDEGNAFTLMGGRKLIWLKDADNHAAQAVSDFVKHVQSDSFLLISAGNLTKSSVLRTDCEENQHILAVACYTDDEKDIKRNILTFLQKNEYNISPEALSILAQRINENRISLKSELTKLITYLDNKKEIKVDDIYKVISNTSSVSIDYFCQNVAEGKFEKTDFFCQHLLKSGETPVSLIRYLMSYFNNLLLGVNLIRKKTPIETVLKKILRSNQFKLKEPVTQQLYFWDESTLTKVIPLLMESEKQMKTTGFDPDLILNRTLIKIQSAAKKQRTKHF